MTFARRPNQSPSCGAAAEAKRSSPSTRVGDCAPTILLFRTMKFLSLFFLLSTVTAHTQVAILELGVRRGTVHRIQTASAETTVVGATSFLQAMHGTKTAQQAGMNVVPDLFQRADAGIVIGVPTAESDLNAAMPQLAALLEDCNQLAGRLEIPGPGRRDALLHKVGRTSVVAELSDMPKAAGLKSVQIDATVAANTALDEALHRWMTQVDEQARKDGKTIMVYLVVEEADAAIAERRQQAADNADAQAALDLAARRRRLEEMEEGEAKEEEQGEQQQQGGDNNGFYGYGYFNDYGEWVTPYKSMFQIQYFNVVLWTSIGLTVVLLFTIYLMMFMPLEPDTLLFGESAKMVGDD